MRALTATELLEVWERGSSQSPPRRMLGLLAAAYPEVSREQLAELPIGERDRRLLQLREWLFGSKLATVTSCPRCGEQLESSLDVSDMLGHAVPAGGGSSAGRDAPGRDAAPGVVEASGYRVRFRLPTSQDLLALPAADEEVTAGEENALRACLLARCVLDARDANDEPVDAASLPDEVVAALSREMAVSDPHAAIELALECPVCEHAWRALLDVARFLWAEIVAWAQRTLREVHCLARAYGWCEADVLALSPTRRQIYLELSRQ
jgi:hypothetical protein